MVYFEFKDYLEEQECFICSQIENRTDSTISRLEKLGIGDILGAEPGFSTSL